MLILRDMKEEDIEDYVRWFTVDTEWSDAWDAPWEKFSTIESEERKSWTEYYLQVKDLTNEFRYKFEIEVDGIHIGWVSSYYDLDYIDNVNKIIAIGIDIPEKKYRGHGYGTLALKMFIDYLFKNNKKEIFIQTWSGNLPMIKVIERLGFIEYFRKKDYRTVNNKKYDAITYLLKIK